MDTILMDKMLINKNEITIAKQNKTDYMLTFTIENAAIHLINMVNPNLIKLIYDLNVDFFDKISIEKINECESNIFLLVKDLFGDIGLSQYYFYFHITHSPTDQQFIITPLCANESITKNLECIDLKKCIMQYSLVNPHQIEFKARVNTEEELESPIIEKIICNIIYKIFNRVKQFVFTIRI